MAAPLMEYAQNQKQQVKISYIVLRVADINESAAFYSALGFVITPERHETGPEHYSFPLGDDSVIELYPLSDKQPVVTQGMRLGVEVPNFSEVKKLLLDSGVQISRESSADSKDPWFVVTDPSGNLVQVTQM